MTVDEMIRKFSCELAALNGQEGIKVWGKPTAKQVEELKAAKPKIIAELKKRTEVAEARKAVEEAKRQAEIEGIKNGTVKIVATFNDGEYLMGYEIFGEAGKLLEEIGVAKYVSGWGYHISDKAIEALGTEFTYQEALEYTRPIREEAEAKKAQEAAELQAKFDEAKATGQRVLIKTWCQGCCDPKEECSMDVHSEYAMPDGSTSHTWTHTW